MKLDKYLKKNGISAAQFARLSGLSCPTIHNILHDRRQFFNLETMTRLHIASEGEITLDGVVGKDNYGQIKKEIRKRADLFG